MKITNIIIVMLLTLMAVSCGDGKVQKSLLPGVSGSAGEVLVVMDRGYWSKDTGKQFKNLLTEDTPGLPQSEPLFNVINIPRKAFSELFRIHRNIIITKIDNSVEKPGIKVEYDRWAVPQIVITIVAPNSESFDIIFDKNADNILSLLYKIENKRLSDNYTKYSELLLIDKLEKRTGVHLTIPKGYTYDLDTNNFIWISHETPAISQGIFVYYYDYKDSSAFTVNSLIDKRNEMLKLYVGGEGKGSYMTTELQVFPTFRSFNLKDKYTAELRGLWKVEGDFMGGPFVSVSQLDEKTNRIYTVDGYVYAPKYNKREYVRQLEAILYSLRFVDKE